jgi:alkaline phosphatase
MLRKAIPVSSFILSLATALFAGDGRVVAYPFGPPARLRAARNVIFLVPDGMGLADVTATRIFKNGPGGDPLNLESLDYVGYQRTWAADATITDSAAAASAWACGEKFEDGQVCMRRDGSFPPSLLEIARDHGRRTGLVATATITNATPAAFGSHVARRSCETEIARQYIESSRVDVMLGGGTSKFRPAGPDACGADGDYIAEAVEAGYRFVANRDELADAVSAGATKILGLFASAGMTAELSRSANSTEPRLPEMAAAALDVLEEAPRGFFLLIEGSQVDWEKHANRQSGQLAEMLAFDETVGVVLNWLEAERGRSRSTLVIVAPDHETGGFAITGPAGRLSSAGETVDGAWITGGHTGTDVPIWSQGPGAWRLARPIDNTEVHRVVRDALR